MSAHGKRLGHSGTRDTYYKPAMLIITAQLLTLRHHRVIFHRIYTTVDYVSNPGAKEYSMEFPVMSSCALVASPGDLFISTYAASTLNGCKYKYWGGGGACW